MKKNKFYLKHLLITLVITLLFPKMLFSYPWPMRNAQDNFDGPLQINATLGEDRERVQNGDGLSFLSNNDKNMRKHTGFIIDDGVYHKKTKSVPVL